MAEEQEIGTLVTKFVADLTDLEAGVNKYSNEMDKTAAATEKTSQTTKEWTDIVKKVGDETGKTTDTTKEYKDQVDKTSESVKGLDAFQINLAASLSNAQMVYVLQNRH